MTKDTRSKKRRPGDSDRGTVGTRQGKLERGGGVLKVESFESC